MRILACIFALCCLPIAALAAPIPSTQVPGVSQPINGTTSATASTWTTLAVANPLRHDCYIQAGADPINLYFGPTAPTQPEITLAAGASTHCLDQQEIWVESTTASAPYQGASW